MKKCVLSLMLVGVLCGICFGANGDMGKGTEPLTDGSAEYPWLIEDLADFDVFRGDTAYWAYGVYTRLECDLDLSSRSFSYAPIGGDPNPNNFSYDGPAYSGNFDGNGHTISNLRIYGAYYCGLFGQLGSGSISNLGLEDIYISSLRQYVGGLVGYNSNGTINNCYTTGRVFYKYSNAITSNVTNFGGLVGRNYGRINSSYTTCMVSGASQNVLNNKYLGGLVGYNSGTIISSYSTGDVLSGRRTVYLGGLAGYNTGTISDSYSTSLVRLQMDSQYAGGLVGENRGCINRSYSAGSTTGASYSRVQEYFGGLVGYNSGDISNCYSTKKVVGYIYVGGLVGYNTGNIRKSYSAGINSGYEIAGGLVGVNIDGNVTDCFWDFQTSVVGVSSGGRSKTTAEMKSALTYQGWNDGSWVINQGNDYPHFAWEGTAGTVIATDYPVATYPGDGTEKNPFELDNSIDLFTFSNRSCDWEQYFVLTSDIDMEGVTNYFPPTCFSGVFNGQGYRIKNLSINANTFRTNNQLGFIGHLSNGIIINLGVENISITSSSDYVGGLAGYSSGTIDSSYLTGYVCGKKYVAGLVGKNSGIIANSYTTALINASDNGGCFAINHGSIINSYVACPTPINENIRAFAGGSNSNCFWDVDTSGMGSSGDTQDGATGKTTTEMQSASTFMGADWDFLTVWGIMEGQEYPKLLWQTTGSPSCGQVDISSEANLFWAPVDEAISYDVYFGTDNPPLTRVADDATDLHFDPGTLKSSTTYYWQVVANTPAGEVAGDVWHFTTLHIAGKGTAEDPYVIVNIAGFQKFINDSLYWKSDVHTRLDCDLDLSGLGPFSQAPIAGASSGPIFYGIAYAGHFNGNGHVIRNLIVNGTYFCGLFGQVDFGSTIIDLGMENVSISGSDNYIGGLAGRIGYQNMSAGSITKCYTTGTVTGNNVVGGLVGQNRFGDVSNSYSTCTVTGNSSVGGLVGSVASGRVNKSYSTGSVAGNSDFGGLVGYNNYFYPISGFWDVETSGIGSADDNNFGAIGEMTGEMQTLSTFTDAGWDFDSDQADWYMPVGGYPRLMWQYNVVDLEEFAALSRCWLTDGCIAGTACDIVDWFDDDVIDMHDLHLLSLHWLGEVSDLQFYRIPQGRWGFDEASGTTVRDGVGGLDGELVNGPTWQPAGGRIAGALELDGIDDMVTLPGEILDPSRSFSVMLWVKLETKLGTSSQVILQQEGTTGRTLLYRLAGDDKLGSYFGSTASASETAVFATAGAWHHVALTYDQVTRTMKFYVDGQLDGANGVVGEPASGIFKIGTHKDGANFDNNARWAGLVDDMRVYHRPLTAGEVAGVLAAGSGR